MSITKQFDMWIGIQGSDTLQLSHAITKDFSLWWWSFKWYDELGGVNIQRSTNRMVNFLLKRLSSKGGNDKTQSASKKVKNIYNKREFLFWLWFYHKTLYYMWFYRAFVGTQKK